MTNILERNHEGAPRGQLPKEQGIYKKRPQAPAVHVLGCREGETDRQTDRDVNVARSQYHGFFSVKFQMTVYVFVLQIPLEIFFTFFSMITRH